jgi:hypothetical protein
MCHLEPGDDMSRNTHRNTENKEDLDCQPVPVPTDVAQVDQVASNEGVLLHLQTQWQKLC